MRKGFPHPLFFVLGLLLLLFSCKKKYDYGNIVTPDLLSSQHEKMPLDVPALSGSETLSPVFLLDADGCQRLVSEINSFGLVAVSLDLSGCDVPVDAKLGAVLPSGLFFRDGKSCLSDSSQRTRDCDGGFFFRMR
ncbi:MAG: hypothetical protein ILP07_07495 [Treponema sp.]|nr:hypothetical protein [Treponema sp.]